MPKMIPLSALSFEEMHLLESEIAEWKVPKWETSRFISLMTTPQRAAISFYFWIGMLMVPAGIITFLVTWNWLWLLVIPAAYFVFKANRRSADQFFLENLQQEHAFYDAAVKDGIKVLLVLKEGS